MEKKLRPDCQKDSKPRPKQIPNLLLKARLFLLFFMAAFPSFCRAWLESENKELIEAESAYKSAERVYNTLVDKSVSLVISSKIFNDRHLQSMWYVDYVEVRNFSSIYLGTHDPLLRVVTVMERGIYFKKFKTSWKDLNPLDKELARMDVLKELPASDGITAAKMERNNSVLVVAYKNLSVEIIDFRSVTEGTKKGNFSYSAKVMDSSYKFGREDDHEVLSIGLVPGTDLLVFSSNRFEILKADRKTGMILDKEKNPLDNIGIIEAPCLSHRADLDPYQPTKSKDPEISTKNLKIGLKTNFIITGADDPMNAVLDWTTMKPIFFFSMHLLSIKATNREDNIIHSIAYYGAVPQGHFYTITTRGSTPYTFLYSGIHQRVMKEIDLGVRSKNKVCSWVYHTTYISIYYPEPNNQKGTPIIKIISLVASNFISSPNKRIIKMENDRIPRFELAHMFTQLGKKPSPRKSYYLENIYELDSLYLAVLKNGNTVRVQAPPVHWDHCSPLPNGETRLGKYGYMFYGREMRCDLLKDKWNHDESLYIAKKHLDGFYGECIGGLSSETFVQNQGEEGGGEAGGEGGDVSIFGGKRLLLGITLPRTLRTCTKPRCKNDKILHYDDTTRMDESATKFPLRKPFNCKNKFMLDPKMKDFANDNGCQPRYCL